MIPIQTSITGYSGKACSLFSVYDPESQVLVVGVEAEFRRDRREKTMVITNVPDIERDLLFSEAHFKDAISAFFNMQGGMALDGNSARLNFNDRAQRANPSNVIEKDGIDASGQKYRISENASNAHVAALATCWYCATRCNTVQNVLAMADALRDIDVLRRGGIVTI